MFLSRLVTKTATSIPDTAKYLGHLRTGSIGKSRLSCEKLLSLPRPFKAESKGCSYESFREIRLDILNVRGKEILND